MNIQQDIEFLEKYEHFFRFLRSIREMREQEIQNLEGAEDSRVQQIAGTILAYQNILELANYDDLKEKFRDFM